jgi:hypothetical protein
VTGDGDERAAPARTVYELHVIHPKTDERHTQQLKNVFAELLGELIMLGSPGNVFVKVTLEIVDRRTHATVLSLRELVEGAQGMVELIDADLDRLDAATFADEWGIART